MHSGLIQYEYTLVFISWFIFRSFRQKISWWNQISPWEIWHSILRRRRVYDANFVQLQLSSRNVWITSTSEARLLGPRRSKLYELTKFPQMADSLKRWLRTRLGAIMDLTPETFGRYTRDGTILAQILHSYDIISSNQLSTIRPTRDPALSRVNLRSLGIWLKLINVTINEKCIDDISKVPLQKK